MKKTLMVLASVMMVSVAVPAFAETPSGIEGAAQCAVSAESIQQKISRLQADVKDGKKTLTPAQLKKLQAKLDEANKMLDQMAK